MRSVTSQTTNGSDWHCMNKPSTCGGLPGPNGNGPVSAASGKSAPRLTDERLLASLVIDAGSPSPAPPNVPPPTLPAPKPGGCLAQNCAEPYIQSARARWDLLYETGEEAKKVNPQSPDFAKDFASWVALYHANINAYNAIRAACLKKCGVDIGAYDSSISPIMTTTQPQDPIQQIKSNAARMAQEAQARADKYHTGALSDQQEKYWQQSAFAWEQLAADPPATSYSDVAEPAAEAPDVRAGATEVERPIASTTLAHRWQVAYLNACRTSCERYQGAEAVKDAKAMLQQAGAMRRFAVSALEADRRARRGELSCERWELSEQARAIGAVAEKGVAWEQAAAVWRQRLEAAGIQEDPRDALTAAGGADLARPIASGKLQDLTPEVAKTMSASCNARMQWIDELPAGLAGRRTPLQAEPIDLTAWKNGALWSFNCARNNAGYSLHRNTGFSRGATSRAAFS